MRTLTMAALATVAFAWAAPQAAAQAAECEAEYVLAPDNSALSILFSNLTVEGRDMAVECSIDVPLTLPAGMSLGVYRVDYRGFANLPKKGSATLEVDYELGPKGNGRQFKRSVRGETSEEFTFTENIGAGLMKRVGCGVDARLRGRVALALVGGNDEALVTLDSGDGASRRGLVYRFDLKKC